MTIAPPSKSAFAEPDLDLTWNLGIAQKYRSRSRSTAGADRSWNGHFTVSLVQLVKLVRKRSSVSSLYGLPKTIFLNVRAGEVCGHPTLVTDGTETNAQIASHLPHFKWESKRQHRGIAMHSRVQNQSKQTRSNIWNIPLSKLFHPSKRRISSQAPVPCWPSLSMRWQLKSKTEFTMCGVGV